MQRARELIDNGDEELVRAVDDVVRPVENHSGSVLKSPVSGGRIIAGGGGHRRKTRSHSNQQLLNVPLH